MSEPWTLYCCAFCGNSIPPFRQFFRVELRGVSPCGEDSCDEATVEGYDAEVCSKTCLRGIITELPKPGATTWQSAPPESTQDRPQP